MKLLFDYGIYDPLVKGKECERINKIYGENMALAKQQKKTEEIIEEKSANQPSYKGDGVAVWVNTDKNGNEYLSIKLLNSINVAAFPYPYPKKE